MRWGGILKEEREKSQGQGLLWLLLTRHHPKRHTLIYGYLLLGAVLLRRAGLTSSPGVMGPATDAFPLLFLLFTGILGPAWPAGSWPSFARRWRERRRGTAPARNDGFPSRAQRL